MKKYYFLSGLPRSGNTLLSAILNQNPKIYSSPLSPVKDILLNYDNLFKTEENFLREENQKKLTEFGNNIIENYYKDINNSIIIDRAKGWGLPDYFNLIKKYITPSPKVIFTVRPVIEILTSFINILPENSYIDQEMEEKFWWNKNFLNKNDNRCDYLMRPYGQIDNLLFSLNNLLNLENIKNVCLIEYNDIIKDPEKTMHKIYNFLELPYHKHDFNNIIKLETGKENIKHPKDMHEIRKILAKKSKNPQDVLSNYVINKYSNEDWWYNYL